MSVPPIEITSSSGWGENTITRFGKMLSRDSVRSLRQLGVCRLAARPAGDRRLQMPEDLDVDVVRRAALGEQILQAFFVVVLVGELEDRLLELAGEPDDGLADLASRPIRPAPAATACGTA